MNQMKLQDRVLGIEEFLAVAAEGSFVGAARVLGMTPSGVGKAVQRLEQRLGVPLFVRTTRRVSITEDGEAFRLECERLIQHLDAAEADLDMRHDNLAGPIRIGAPVAYGRLKIAPYVARFSKQHPDVSFDLRFSDLMHDPVKDRLDLIIRIGELEDSSMWARRIDNIRFGLFASKSYFGHAGVPKTVGELTNFTVLNFVMTNGKSLHLNMRGPSGEISVSPAKSIVSDDIEAVIALAEADAGLAFVPTFLVDEHLKSARLVPVLKDHWTDGPPVYALHPTPGRVARRLRAFSDVLAKDANKSAD